MYLETLTFVIIVRKMTILRWWIFNRRLPVFFYRFHYQLSLFLMIIIIFGCKVLFEDYAPKIPKLLKSMELIMKMAGTVSLWKNKFTFLPIQSSPLMLQNLRSHEIRPKKNCQVYNRCDMLNRWPYDLVHTRIG